MGTPKAALRWHGTSLVAHVAGVLGSAVDGPVVVVHARGQKLPTLPAGVELSVDRHDGLGPLAGLAAGLAAVERRAPAAFVAAVDLPLLNSALVRRVAASLGTHWDAAVPREKGRAHPLAAAYRTSLWVSAEELLDEGRRRVLDLLERARVRWLDEAELLADPDVAAVDPALSGLRNLNSREDYEAALAGFPAARQ
jgi:molybdopterin-guanine dinucleotide biosynthesis protein A